MSVVSVMPDAIQGKGVKTVWQGYTGNVLEELRMSVSSIVYPVAGVILPLLVSSSTRRSGDMTNGLTVLEVS
jgi:hypothetical protein